MKIRIPLYAQHLNQAEFVQLMSSTVDTLKQYRSSSNNPMVADLTQRLEDSLPLMKKSLKQKRGSDLTKELKQALKIRNIDFSAFVGGLKLFQNARTVEKLKAYQTTEEFFALPVAEQDAIKQQLKQYDNTLAGLDWRIFRF